MQGNFQGAMRYWPEYYQKMIINAKSVVLG